MCCASFIPMIIRCWFKQFDRFVGYKYKLDTDSKSFAVGWESKIGKVEAYSLHIIVNVAVC
jgi:hypothetical protein